MAFSYHEFEITLSCVIQDILIFSKMLTPPVSRSMHSSVKKMLDIVFISVLAEPLVSDTQTRTFCPMLLSQLVCKAFFSAKTAYACKVINHLI